MTSRGEVELASGVGGWPTMFELAPGEAHRVTRSIDGRDLSWEVKFIDKVVRSQPLLYSKADVSEHFAEATVTVEVNGVRADLCHRAYALPQTIEGLRLYVECLPRWSQVGFSSISPPPMNVRFSACAATETWGPREFRFPVSDYRWRSSPYVNSWMSVVPQAGQLYFHKGEDFGAIPDHLSVVSCLDATVAESPLPDGDGRSNAILLDFAHGYRARYSHFNIEHVGPQAAVGSGLAAGEAFARTGSTWNGERSQKHDPHLHFSLYAGEHRFSTYPTSVEAYLRDYEDVGLAVAGGYVFGTDDSSVILDSRRSVAREGHAIRRYQWRLCNGATVDEPVATIHYSQPGFYAEELTITLDDGSIARDIAQVRIFPSDSENGKAVSGFAGWIHHTPVRGIKPGTEVTFQKALWVKGDLKTIDFGDGTPPQPCKRFIKHSYDKPGFYTVAIADPDSFTWIKSVVVVEE